jgi:hypothetical protein
MSIGRIDFQGAIARTNDIAQIKANEDNRAMTNQNTFQTQFDKEVDQKANSVNEKENADQNKQEKFDAKEKGKNEYSGNGGKGEKKKREHTKEDIEKLSETLIGPDGRPLDMHISSGFDFKI